MKPTTIQQFQQQYKDSSSLMTFAHDVVQRIKNEDQAKGLNAIISYAKNLEEQTQTLVNLSESEKKQKALFAVPVVIKDNICTQGEITTAGSKMLQNFVSPISATLVTRLQSAGALIVAKANLDEFAMGSSSETSVFGACRNPVNTDYVAGGSSGGSAAVVASGWVPGAIGTDTGGSVRQPASFCGVVGFKPTYGRISRYGLIAFASSLDQAGTFTASVQDAETFYKVMAGFDPNDLTTSDRATLTTPSSSIDWRGKKIALIKEFEESDWNNEVRDKYNKFIQNLRDKGAVVDIVSVPLVKASVPTYYIVSSCEAASNLSRFDGIKYGYRTQTAGALELEDIYRLSRGEGFGIEVKRRILSGTFALASGYYQAYYLQAARLRRKLQMDFDHVLKQYDVVMNPVSATLPFKLGEKLNDPIKMYTSDEFTTWVNLCGYPSMSIPLARSSSNLPIGIQLTCGAFCEDKLFSFSQSVEQVASENL